MEGGISVAKSVSTDSRGYPVADLTPFRDWRCVMEFSSKHTFSNTPFSKSGPKLKLC